MARLMDMGLQQLTNLAVDMANLSTKTVQTAIEAYRSGMNVTRKIFSQSEQLRILQDEGSEIAVELIARYQPVATDLRYIKSCMEIAYGFSRFGRYAYDIAEVLDMFGDASKLDATTDKEIQVMSAKVLEMIDVGVKAFLNKDVAKEAVLERMDDEVDDMYVAHIKRVLKNPEKNAAANISATLIMRYLERIADHANYLGETVNYIVKGERKPRK